MTEERGEVRGWPAVSVPGDGAAQMAQHLGGVALVAAGALGFSTIILFARWIHGMGALSIAFYRAAFSFLFFTVLLVLTRKREAFHPARYRSVIPHLVGLGLSVGVTGVLYVYAVQRTTAAAATLLNNASAVYVTLLAPWLLKEPRRRYGWLSLGLAIVGIVCIANPRELAGLTASAIGALAATLSGFSLACMMLLGRAIRGRVDPLVQSWWSMGIAALLVAPWSAQVSAAALAPNLPYLATLGIAAQGIPYTLYFLGLRRTSAQVVSIVALLEPVAGILLGALVFGEIPGVLGSTGILLIVGAIILASR